MIPSKEHFLQVLKQSLPKTVNKADVIREYELHIEEKMFDQPHLKIEDVLDQLGDPVEIAKQYGDVEPIAKSFVSRNFVFCNLMFFLIGGLLTVCYHVFEDSILSEAWGLLAQIPLTIVIVYTVFWMVLGFEIGREYGLLGKELFSKTVFISLVPNILLMIMTLFHFIPVNWFQPILTPAFIAICVIMTFLIYPISKVFYYIGVYRSV
ncbi:MAG: HAAS signaling domain-containing protein [Bacillota bacterium]